MMNKGSHLFFDLLFDQILHLPENIIFTTEGSAAIFVYEIMYNKGRLE